MNECGEALSDDEAPVSATRRRNMQAIRSKNTEPEMRVRRIAFALGYRYRLHDRGLPGRPDLVFPKLRIAIFVHGCFWHQHPGCPKATIPATRRSFWEAKLGQNVERDGRSADLLSSAGWKVVIIWECETRNPEVLRERLQKVLGGMSAEMEMGPTPSR